MQNLKPAKEFRTLIANEESLDALLEIKGHLEYYPVSYTHLDVYKRQSMD